MREKFVRVIFFLMLMAFITHCNKRDINSVVKFYTNDPFKSTIVPSQRFEIDSRLDNVVEGESGIIVILPKGCFRKANGDHVEEPVSIELSEALTVEDMVLSNLTTTSHGKLLETGGMVYFNATSNGEQLVISKDNPIQIEIPTRDRKAGMKAYKGIRDENGNMNWIEPREIDDYLLTVDMKSLDFLPEGFRYAVAQGMPFRRHKEVTNALTDSLYYTLALPEYDVSLNNDKLDDYNEPYYNSTKEVKRRKYTKNSFSQRRTDSSAAVDIAPLRYDCGVNPATIKTIRSKKYHNTFIATREFEARLQAIFLHGDNSILEIYINNLDKDLYVVDSIAALRSDAKGLYMCFHALDDFSKKRQTNVKNADKYAKLLKGYYQKQLAQVLSELEKDKQKAIKAIGRKNKEEEKIVNDYKKMLWKRERYRMETYGFNWTDTGWINIDNGTLPKTWGSGPLEVIVANGKEFDRVHTYVIYSSIKSLYRLNTNDNENFYVGEQETKEMLMPKQESAVVIVVGYKGDHPSVGVKTFETMTEVNLVLRLEPSTTEKLRDLLKEHNNYSRENRVEYDLQVMNKLYHEKVRKKELTKEREFIRKLIQVAYPRCSKNLAL